MNEKKQILLVANQMIRPAALQSAYDVLSASCTGEALALLRTKAQWVSAVILAISGMEELHFLRAARTFFSVCAPVFLAVVPYEDEKLRGFAQEYGADDLLIAPFDLPILLLRVQNAVKSRETEEKCRAFAALMDECAQREEALCRKANYDAVTGLYNRAATEEMVVNYLHARTGDDGTMFVMLDIDNFKTVNDTHGHMTGDELLLGLGDAFKSVCRRGDFVGRIGGDEFAALLHRDAHQTTEQLLGELLAKVKNMDQALHLDMPVTVSMGATYVLDTDRDFRGLVFRADIALYQAKNSGKNRFVLYKNEKLTA